MRTWAAVADGMSARVDVCLPPQVATQSPPVTHRDANRDRRRRLQLVDFKGVVTL